MRYAMIYDHLGSLRALRDEQGRIVKEVEYDSFGNVVRDSAPDFFIPIGFAGGVIDPLHNLVHFVNRDYDPEVGRWTAKDPIGYAGGDADLYGYCHDDPVNGVDPLGLFGMRKRRTSRSSSNVFLSSGQLRSNWARRQAELTPFRYSPYSSNVGLLGKDQARWLENNAPVGAYLLDNSLDYLFSGGLSRQRCNEFTCDALTEGSPSWTKLSNALSRSGYPYWRVSDFTDTSKTEGLFQRFDDTKRLKQGDIFIMYDEDRDVHHSGIYVGDGEVAYGGPEGAKLNTLQEVEESLRTTPFFLRPSSYGRAAGVKK